MCMSRPTALRLAYCCVKGHVRLCSKCKPPLPPAKASGSGKCCDTLRLTKGIVASHRNYKHIGLSQLLDADGSQCNKHSLIRSLCVKAIVVLHL